MDMLFLSNEWFENEDCNFSVALPKSNIDYITMAQMNVSSNEEEGIWLAINIHLKDGQVVHLGRYCDNDQRDVSNTIHKLMNMF